MDGLYYLCFSVNRLPDLTLTKYSVYDGSSVENIMNKHGVFLRQLHRLGHTAGVYFHLLYYYNPDKSLSKGNHLSIIFYATAQDKSKLDGIREFLTTSVLNTYYNFYCYEIARSFSLEEEKLSDGSYSPVLQLTNISGKTKRYSLGKVRMDDVLEAQEQVSSGARSHVVCEIDSDSNTVLSFNSKPVDAQGKIILDKKFSHAAFLTKKDYSLPAQNHIPTDAGGDVYLYSIMEWEPCETGRLYNVLKLMEGYDRHAVLRIDIFPIEHTQIMRQCLPYTETRRRISDRAQGKDDNSESIVKSWDKYLNNMMKFPQFRANVVAFADSQDIAVMLADSVAAEAVESGTYLIETMASPSGYSIYESDARILHVKKEPGNYVAQFLSTYTLEEMRPMFSFPILYPGESIECLKETDPKPFPKEVVEDKETGELHEVISLGVSNMGYDVTFPVKLFKKHAFIAGVPGAGKTNTMLYLVTTLWKYTRQKIPFLVLEPAKQEYRALAMIDGMEKLCVFSPGADTRFPLHINPFQFPVGLTLAEHIANLNAVFAGAFELIPPSPFLIDACIEKVYLDKGWNINERNDGTKPYPTMQDLFDSLKIAVEESGYEGESKANIRSVMEVRIGSLLRREIGNVYNVHESSLNPEDWLECPAIIELEALGEGPANFMSLLISTLIREVLKIRKTSDLPGKKQTKHNREIEHIIFYEEAHNLIGPTTEDPVGGSVNPKISATKYLVKMLAEVRALGEGIVIADQLPTAMAPEVLKNTGLKLGHRITAKDDRELLGSTMSASADQLEEQGTFDVGYALIFYENLLKPFKMRMAEWEKGAPKTKYNSPTNLQLFERLKDNETYTILLERSKEIMQKKMEVEFDILRRRAKELKKKIDSHDAEVKIIEKDIAALKRKLERENTGEVKKQIEVKNLSYEKKMLERSGKITHELEDLCWEYANMYYAYMTLSRNYYIHMGDMFMCTINNYLSLFSVLGSLVHVPELAEVLVSKTDSVMTDIRRYIDVSFEGSSAILSEHSGHNYALLYISDLTVNRIAVEIKRMLEKAARIRELPDGSEKEVSDFSDEFAKVYFSFGDMADAHLQNVEALLTQLKEDLDMYIPDPPRWEETNRKITECEQGTWKIHMALARFVIAVFEQLGNLDSENRRTFLIKTVPLLASFRKMLDYRNKNTPALLSQHPRYDDLWKRAVANITCMEMSARFARLHQNFLELASAKAQASDEDKKAFLVSTSEQFGSCFRSFFPAAMENDGIKLILMTQYMPHLENMINIGGAARIAFSKELRANWGDCLVLLKGLKDARMVNEENEEKWNRIVGAVLRILSQMK